MVGGRGRPPSENFLGAIKSVIADVKYYTKYVKSSLSTNSKIAGISVAIQLSNSFRNESLVTIFRGAEV